MKKTYTMNELSTITGLTTRTLRNYMKAECLTGDKSTGQWLFSEEEVNTFIRHPSVYPSIQAKNKAIIFDFLGNETKAKNEICTIIDLHISKAESKEMMHKMCSFITNSNVEHVRFSYEHHHQNTRIILSGYALTVLKLIDFIDCIRKEDD